MLSAYQEDTKGRMEEHRKRRETLGEEYKIYLEHMKQIQRGYQEITNSIESWENCLKETKDKLQNLEEQLAMCDHERKDLLKMTRK